MGRLWGLLAACLLLAAQAAAEVQDRHILRVGYTSFESPRELAGDPTLADLRRYLETVSRSSREAMGLQVAFDVYVGNYYQVYDWLRRGLLDMAVVSPLVAFLLDEEALPLVELVEHDAAVAVQGRTGLGEKRGQIALVRSSQVGDPQERFHAALSQIANCARVSERKAGFECVQALEVEFEFVSHLSASGFIAPLIAIQAWLRDEVGSGTLLSERFWELLFRRVSFQLTHGGRSRARGIERFSFSYSGRAGLLGGSQGFAPLEADAGRIRIPHDVLVLRRELARELGLGAGVANLGPWRTGDWGRAVPGGAYRGDAYFDAEAHRAFRDRLDFFRGDFSGVWQRWYVDEQYSFTVDEVLCFLGQDQHHHPGSELAVVLPGGGVKAAYQASALDSLYAQQRLDSGGSTARAGMGCPDGADGSKPLDVAHFVGTSGGALTAAFAALEPTAERARPLSAVWATLSEDLIYPWFDIMRWASGLVSLAVIVVILLGHDRLVVARRRAQSGTPRTELRRRLGLRPRPVQVLSLLVLLVAPAVIANATQSVRSERLALPEALLYFGTVLVTLALGLSPEARERRGNPVVLPWLAAFFVVALVAAVGTAIAFGMDLGALPLHGAGAGLLLLLFLLGAVTFEVRRQRVDAHLLGIGAMGVIAVMLAASLAQLPPFALRALGVGTVLELTPSYWGVLLGSSVASGLLLVILLRRFEPVRAFLCEHRRETWLPFAPAVSLSLALFFAFFYWNFWIAAGLYENDGSSSAFEDRLRAFAGDPTPDFTRATLATNLVITAASLDPVLVREDPGDASRLRGIPPGDVYVCYGDDCGDGGVLSQRWIAEAGRLGTLPDVAFASGAAFPIFPAHLVTGGSFERGYLIDGGYGHNLPIEAAALAGARQVLVVNSSPRQLGVPCEGDQVMRGGAGAVEAHRRFNLRGQLVDYVLRIFPFMFERIQQVDERMRERLVVASISPGPCPAFPALTDFRASTIEALLRRAERDLASGARLARIESWGVPGAPVVSAPERFWVSAP